MRPLKALGITGVGDAYCKSSADAPVMDVDMARVVKTEGIGQNRKRSRRNEWERETAKAAQAR